MLTLDKRGMKLNKTKTMTYFDTTKLKGKELATAIATTRTQDEIIKGIIKGYGTSPFSPKTIFNDFPTKGTPITSIRRSLDTLKRANYIEETGEKVKGLYGRSELQLKKR